MQEIFDEFNVGWERELVTPPVRVLDGRIQIPEAPGLGVDLNWPELTKHPYRSENFLPLFKPGWERRENAAEASAPGVEPGTDGSDST